MIFVQGFILLWCFVVVVLPSLWGRHGLGMEKGIEAAVAIIPEPEEQ